MWMFFRNIYLLYLLIILKIQQFFSSYEKINKRKQHFRKTWVDGNVIYDKQERSERVKLLKLKMLQILIFLNIKQDINIGTSFFCQLCLQVTNTCLEHIIRNT